MKNILIDIAENFTYPAITKTLSLGTEIKKHMAIELNGEYTIIYEAVHG